MRKTCLVSYSISLQGTFVKVLASPLTQVCLQTPGMIPRATSNFLDAPAVVSSAYPFQTAIGKCDSKLSPTENVSVERHFYSSHPNLGYP